MAKRYGGAYSPGAKIQKYSSKSEARGEKKRGYSKAIGGLSIAIFVAGALELGKGDVLGAVLEWGAAAGLLLANWLYKEGERAANAFYARKRARPPKLPRKIVASIIISLSVGAIILSNGDYGFFNGLAFSILGGVLSLIAFGPDPIFAKGLNGTELYETERAQRAIETAQTYVDEALQAIKMTGDRRLIRRVEALAGAAQDMFDTISEDPRDLTSARKYLSVYLKGARDATDKFVKVYLSQPKPEMREKYVTLLSDLEDSFEAKREALLQDNHTDLDVEIEVLQERLAHEK